MHDLARPIQLTALNSRNSRSLSPAPMPLSGVSLSASSSPTATSSEILGKSVPLYRCVFLIKKFKTKSKIN